MEVRLDEQNQSYLNDYRSVDDKEQSEVFPILYDLKKYSLK